MYIYYHFQQNISKNHVTFRFSNLPSPPGPCDLTGQKGGGLNLCKQNLTPQVLKICQTTKSPISTKKTFKWQLDLGLPIKHLHGWSLVEKLGPMPWSHNMCCCFFKSSKQFTCLSSICTYIYIHISRLRTTDRIFSKKISYPSVL